MLNNGVADDFGGVAGLILTCLKKCPVDLRRILAANVVFCGGGACVEGARYHNLLIDYLYLSYLGLMNLIIKNVVDWTKDTEFPEYIALNGCIDSLQAVPVPFNRAALAWVGASMFAANKVFLPVICVYIYNILYL